MAGVFPVFEKAVPEDFRGYFKGDLLYYNNPPIQDKNFVSKPNIVEYAIDVDSDLGKKIAKLQLLGLWYIEWLILMDPESALKDLDVSPKAIVC